MQSRPPYRDGNRDPETSTINVTASVTARGRRGQGVAEGRHDRGGRARARHRFGRDPLRRRLRAHERARGHTRRGCRRPGDPGHAPTRAALFDATIVGTDPISDLAVIKLTDAKRPGCRSTFADSVEAQRRRHGVAIGAPLGLAGTVTNGIVSALNRSITVASSAAAGRRSRGQAPDEGEGRRVRSTSGSSTSRARLDDTRCLVRHDLARRHPDRRGDQPGKLGRRAAERPTAGRSASTSRSRPPA